uniref:ABC transporter domain-containing protein n=1 Tax=Bicosoecida sp. CB-2014 TaxID=1486930 RepID=A0A7S1CKF3_9STRA
MADAAAADEEVGVAVAAAAAPLASASGDASAGPGGGDSAANGGGGEEEGGVKVVVVEEGKCDDADRDTDMETSVHTGATGKSFHEHRVKDVPDEHRVRLSFRDIKYTIAAGGCCGRKTDKHILKGLTGSIRPGELCAIMGPSGAGKSTLLNILAGRLRAGGRNRVSGELHANGRVVDPLLFRKRIAYVLQEDALFATQTPREALQFSAHLRLPPSTTAAQRETLVNETLGALGLDKCADTLIGNAMIAGISGGEKKRTAIAQELIADPSVLALDEPTSGLDSYAAFQVVKILKRLAQSGRTIVTTIHQPSSEVFDLFSRVILLAEGLLIYDGPVDGITRHFATLGFHCAPHFNPADFALFTLQTQDAAGLQRMHEAWVKRGAAIADGDGGEKGGEAGAGDASDGGSDGSGKDRVDVTAPLPTEGKHASFLTQFALLGRREVNNVVRDKGSMIARIGTTVFLNLIVAFVFQNAADWSGTEPTLPDALAKVGSAFGGVVQVALGGMFGLSQPTLLTFPAERVVFLREYAAAQYGIVAYFLSKMLAEIPLMIGQASLIFFCTYWLVGFNGGFVTLTLIVALLGFVASSTSLVIGAAANDVQTALQLTPLLFVPQMLFAGFFIPISSIPAFLRWAQYLCSLKYAINLILLVEFDTTDHMPPESWYDGATPPQEAIDTYQDAVYGCHGPVLLEDGTCTETAGSIYKGALLPRSEVAPSDLWVYFGILVGALALFRTIALVTLARRARA